MRLDPACLGARRLRDAQGTRLRLMAGPGRLGELVSETNAKEAREHLGTCLRCAAYERSCAHCKRDLAYRSHTLFCPDNTRRIATLLGRAHPRRAQKTALPPRAAPAPSPYAVLGLRPGASPDAVRAAYRERARLCHPDVVGRAAPHLRDAAVRSMQQLNAAYDAIRSSW